MSIDFNITTEDILEQLKISRKIPEIMEQILTRRIIRAEAKNIGVKVEIPELQDAADLFRAKNRLISAKITERWLEMNQLSLDEFETIIHLELLSEKLKNKVLTDKVEQHFYQHQLDFGWNNLSGNSVSAIHRIFKWQNDEFGIWNKCIASLALYL